MTHREKLVVSAYTGHLMVSYSELAKFVEKTLGRPVFTHELAYEEVANELQAKLKPEFIKICEK